MGASVECCFQVVSWNYLTSTPQSIPQRWTHALTERSNTSVALHEQGLWPVGSTFVQTYRQGGRARLFLHPHPHPLSLWTRALFPCPASSGTPTLLSLEGWWLMCCKDGSAVLRAVGSFGNWSWLGSTEIKRVNFGLLWESSCWLFKSGPSWLSHQL